MNNKDLLTKAIAIAFEAHKDQKDKYGAPYLAHVSRVMNAGKNEDEKIVGVLHDLIEDTPWTFEQLKAEGFPDHIIAAIECLTKKDENEDYNAFTERVSKNPLAIRVKLNDLRDNMDISRMPQVTEKDAARLNKYVQAYHKLLRMI